MFRIVGLDWLPPVGVDGDANLSSLLSKLGLKTFMANYGPEHLLMSLKQGISWYICLYLVESVDPGMCSDL